ncbi:hypothetical protein D3C87_1650960 [compost metagenome]
MTTRLVLFLSSSSKFSYPIYEKTSTDFGLAISILKLPILSVIALTLVPLTFTVTPGMGTPFSSFTFPVIFKFWMYSTALSRRVTDFSLITTVRSSILKVRSCASRQALSACSKETFLRLTVTGLAFFILWSL